MFALSCWMLGGLNQYSGYWDVYWPRVIQGFGLGFIFVPLTTLMLASIPKPELSSATGVSLLLRQVGGSFGIAILTTLLARETAVAWSALAGGVTQTHGQSVGTLTELVAQSSVVIAYDYLFRLCAIIFVISIPLIFFMSPPRVSSSEGMPAVALD